VWHSQGLASLAPLPSAADIARLLAELLPTANQLNPNNPQAFGCC
jgi:hypothetical protein